MISLESPEPNLPRSIVRMHSLFRILRPLSPLIFYFFAVSTIFFGLYTPFSRRIYFVLPVWILLAFSFQNINYLNTIPGLAYQFGMLITITFFHAPLIFSHQREQLRIETRKDGTRAWNLGQPYKIYNNPRLLPASPGSIAISYFLRHRVLKIMAAVAVRTLATAGLLRVVAGCGYADFSPARESLFRRLYYNSLTSYEVLLRVYLTIMWMVDTVSNNPRIRSKIRDSSETILIRTRYFRHVSWKSFTVSRLYSSLLY